MYAKRPRFASYVSEASPLCFLCMRSVPAFLLLYAKRHTLPASKKQSGDASHTVSGFLFDHFESREAQGFDGVSQLPISNQDIICLESADGKNAYIGLRQRHSDRNKAPDEIQVQRTENLESTPTSAHLDSGGDEVILTYH